MEKSPIRSDAYFPDGFMQLPEYRAFPFDVTTAISIFQDKGIWIRSFVKYTNMTAIFSVVKRSITGTCSAVYVYVF